MNKTKRKIFETSMELYKEFENTVIEGLKVKK